MEKPTGLKAVGQTFLFPPLDQRWTQGAAGMLF